MEKKYTEEEMKAMVKEALGKIRKDENTELSLDDLDNVNGGYQVSETGDSVNISFTDAEYQKMKQYLETDIAKNVISKLGYGDIIFEQNMTLPLEQGREIKQLLDLFFV